MDLNRAQVIGNATRDPETRSTATGQQVCNFGIATNMMWTDAQGQKQQRTEFHNIVAWGKLAEICGQYIKKGKRVFLEGRLQTREWEAQDGTKRRTTEIVADNMILLDRPTGAFGGTPVAAPSGGPLEPTLSPLPGETLLEKSPGEQEIRLEEVPF